ncbi:MAG TPA: hypothetical protein PKB10_11090 [Tepidisphaeraceae bacterium]|nr:hypothetical protein [Tepidisphaeraceae bacterium]
MRSRFPAIRVFRLTVVVIVNLLLAGTIVGLIYATWLPAIRDEGAPERPPTRGRDRR